MPVSPGLSGVAKTIGKGRCKGEKLVINNYKECRVKEETENAKGLPGRVDFAIFLCVLVLIHRFSPPFGAIVIPM